MPINEMTFLLRGAAGQGVESNGEGFTRVLARCGLYAIGVPDYMSRIRGGHNFFQIRISEQSILTPRRPVHLLLAMDEETIRRHAGEVVPGGGIVYDEALGVDIVPLESQGLQPFPAPLERLAVEVGRNPVMVNTAILGVAAGVVERGTGAYSRISLGGRNVQKRSRFASPSSGHPNRTPGAGFLS